MDNRLEKIIQTLEKNGSKLNSDMLKKVKKEIILELKKDQSIKDSLTDLIHELEFYGIQFLEHPSEVISGLSSCIYLPNKSGSSSITMYGGKTNYDESGKYIDEKTIFDVGSITKLYTFLLTHKLMERGYFYRTDKVKDLDSKYQLDDYEIEDILKMSGELRTQRRVTDGKTYKEGMEILRTVYIENKNRSINIYSDIGFIILSDLIKEIVSKRDRKKMSYSDIMKQYLLEPWNLEETMFHPFDQNYVIAGNGNGYGLVHDPKANLLGGAVGSAGIFTTSNGLQTLADNLFEPKNEKYTRLAGAIIYPGANKGFAGIYEKHPLGLDKTFVPNEFGNGSFASEGFTGSLAIFDPKNKIHNNVLVNAIRDGSPTKAKEYLPVLKKFQIGLTEVTIKAYLLNRYYSMIGQNEDVKIKVRTK